jgi:hypothetical protein
MATKQEKDGEWVAQALCGKRHPSLAMETAGSKEGLNYLLTNRALPHVGAGGCTATEHCCIRIMYTHSSAEVAILHIPGEYIKTVTANGAQKMASLKTRTPKSGKTDGNPVPPHQEPNLSSSYQESTTEFVWCCEESI